MLGRDIEIEGKEKKPEGPTLFYLRELSYGLPKKINLRPQSVPTIGMSKIQAKGWKAFFIEYASSASFHGLNHLAAPRRHIFERIGTVVIIIMSLIALTLLSFHFWAEYQNEATVLVLNHDYHNFKIIRPSIVICSNLGVDPAKFPQVFEKYGVEDTEEMRKFFTIIARQKYFYNESTPEVVNVPSSKWLSILHDLKQEIHYGSFSKDASWIITAQGFCQSFYNYAAPYSSYDYWMSDNWTVIPESTDNRLCDHINPNCLTDSLHVKYSGDVFFAITRPGEVIEFSKFTYQTKRKHKSALTLSFEEITTSVELKSLSVKQRNCEFPDEHKLSMWPIYTFNMCIRECTHKKMFEICGCYHHFARPTPGIPTCDLSQLRCIANNIESILRYDKNRAIECGCLKNCHFIRYSEAQFSTYLMNDKAPDESAMDVVLLFPKDKYIHEQVFGFIDFLAAVGGAAGLVLGASILSFVEFFYFATLRCFWYYKKMRSEKVRKFRMKKNSQISQQSILKQN